MKKHHLTLAGRILLSLALATFMALAAAGVSSAASSTTTPTAAQCPTIIGYVCLARADGGFEFIPEGEGRTYPGGLPVVELWNGTQDHYCVAANPFNFGLASGRLVSRATTVFAINPGDFCATRDEQNLMVAPSSAAGTEAQLCPDLDGFVCLAEVDGGFHLIPEGKSRSYPDGLPVVELWNNTKSDYCVGAKPFNFGLGAGELASQSATVLRIGPGKICLT